MPESLLPPANNRKTASRHVAASSPSHPSSSTLEKDSATASAAAARSSQKRQLQQGNRAHQEHSNPSRYLKRIQVQHAHSHKGSNSNSNSNSSSSSRRQAGVAPAALVAARAAGGAISPVRPPRNILDPLQNADMEKSKIIEVLQATEENLREAFTFARTHLAPAHAAAFRSEHLRLCIAVGVASNIVQARECDAQLAGTHLVAFRAHSVGFMEGALRLLRFSTRVRRLLRQLVDVAAWSSRVAHILRLGPDGLRDLQQVATLMQQLSKRFVRLHKLLSLPFPLTTNAVLTAVESPCWEAESCEGDEHEDGDRVDFFLCADEAFCRLKDDALLLRDLRGNKHVKTFLKDALDLTADMQQLLEAMHAAVLENITLLDRRRAMQRALQAQILAHVVPQCEAVCRECELIVGGEAEDEARKRDARAVEVEKVRQRINHHQQQQQQQQQQLNDNVGNSRHGEEIVPFEASDGKDKTPGQPEHSRTTDHEGVHQNTEFGRAALRRLVSEVRTCPLVEYVRKAAARYLSVVRQLQQPTAFTAEPSQKPDPFATAVLSADGLATACRRLRELAIVVLLNDKVRELQQEVASWDRSGTSDPQRWTVNEFKGLLLEHRKFERARPREQLRMSDVSPSLDEQIADGWTQEEHSQTSALGADQNHDDGPRQAAQQNNNKESEHGRVAAESSVAALEAEIAPHASAAEEAEQQTAMTESLVRKYEVDFPLPRVATSTSELEALLEAAARACAHLCRRVADWEPSDFESRRASPESAGPDSMNAQDDAVVFRTAQAQLEQEAQLRKFFRRMSTKSHELQSRVNELWVVVDKVVKKISDRMRTERKAKSAVYLRDFEFMTATHHALKRLLDDKGMSALGELPEIRETFQKMESLVHGHFHLLEQNLEVRDPVAFERGLLALQKSSDRAQQDVAAIKRFVHAQVAEVLEQLAREQREHDELRQVTLRQIDAKIAELHQFVGSQHAQLAYSQKLGEALAGVASQRAQCFSKLVDRLTLDTASVESISTGHSAVLEELRALLADLEATVGAAMDLALSEARSLVARGGVCSRLAHELKLRHVDAASAFVAELQLYVKSTMPVMLRPLPRVGDDGPSAPDEEARAAVHEVAQGVDFMKSLFIDMTLATDECKQLLEHGTLLDRPLPTSLIGDNSPSLQLATPSDDFAPGTASEKRASLPQPLAGDSELKSYTTELQLSIEGAMLNLNRMNDNIRKRLRAYIVRQEQADTLATHARKKLSELKSQMVNLVQPYLGDAQARIHDVAVKCRTRFEALHSAAIQYLDDLSASDHGGGAALLNSGLGSSDPEPQYCNPYVFCSERLLAASLVRRGHCIAEHVKKLQGCLAMYQPELERLSSRRRTSAKDIDQLLKTTSARLRALKRWVRQYAHAEGSAQHLILRKRCGYSVDSSETARVAGESKERSHGTMGSDVEVVDFDDATRELRLGGLEAGEAKDQSPDEENAERAGKGSPWQAPEAPMYTLHDERVQFACQRVDRIELEITTKCGAELNALDLSSEDETDRVLRALERQIQDWFTMAHEACCAIVWDIEDMGVRQLRAHATQRGLWYHVTCGAEASFTRLEVDAVRGAVQATGGRTAGIKDDREDADGDMASDAPADLMTNGYGNFFELLDASLLDAGDFLRQTANSLDLTSWDTLSQSVDAAEALAANLADDVALLTRDSPAVLKNIRTFLPRGDASGDMARQKIARGDMLDEDPTVVKVLLRSRRSNWLRTLAAVGLYAVRPLAQLVYFAATENRRWDRWLRTQVPKPKQKGNGVRGKKSPAAERNELEPVELEQLVGLPANLAIAQQGALGAGAGNALEELRWRVEKSCKLLRVAVSEIVKLAEDDTHTGKAWETLGAPRSKLRALNSKINGLKVQALDTMSSLVALRALCSVHSHGTSDGAQGKEHHSDQLYPWIIPPPPVSVGPDPTLQPEKQANDQSNGPVVAQPADSAQQQQSADVESDSPRELLFSPFDVGLDSDQTGTLSDAIAHALEETTEVFDNPSFQHVLLLQAKRMAFFHHGQSLTLMLRRLPRGSFDIFMDAILASQSVDQALDAADVGCGCGVLWMRLLDTPPERLRSIALASSQSLSAVSARASTVGLGPEGDQKVRPRKHRAPEPVGLTLVGFEPLSVSVYGWRPESAFEVVDLRLGPHGLGPGAGMRAGFCIGDILTHVAGQPIGIATDLVNSTDPSVIGSQGGAVQLVRESANLRLALQTQKRQVHFVDDLHDHVRRVVRTRVVVDWNAALSSFNRAASILNRGVRGWLARTRIKLSASIASTTVTQTVQTEVNKLQGLLDTRVGGRILRRLCLLRAVLSEATTERKRELLGSDGQHARAAEARAEHAAKNAAERRAQVLQEGDARGLGGDALSEQLATASDQAGAEERTRREAEVAAEEAELDALTYDDSTAPGAGGIDTALLTYLPNCPQETTHGSQVVLGVTRTEGPTQALGAFLDQTPRLSAFVPPLVEVMQLREDSVLGEAGCQAGDIIIGCDGQPVHTIQDLSSAIDGAERFKLHVVRPRDPLYSNLPLAMLQAMGSALMTAMTNHIVAQFREKSRGVFLKSGVLQQAKLRLRDNGAQLREQLRNKELLRAFRAAEPSAERLKRNLEGIVDKLFEGRAQGGMPFPLNSADHYRRSLNDAQFGIALYISYVAAFLSSKCAKRAFQTTIPPLDILQRNDLASVAAHPADAAVALGLPVPQGANRSAHGSNALSPEVLAADKGSAGMAEDANPVRALGFHFLVPAPLEYSLWTAPVMFVVSEVAKPAVPRSVAQRYGLEPNDVLMDLQHFSAKLQRHEGEGREEKNEDEWDLMRCLFHLEEQEQFLRQVVAQDEQEFSELVRPTSAPRRSDTAPDVEIGILHMGRHRVKLTEADFVAGVEHIAAMFRCFVARKTSKYFSEAGAVAVLRVQRQYRRRNYYQRFFPLLVDLMEQRKAAVAIQRIARGRRVRAAEARAQHLLVERVVRVIGKRLAIRRKLWQAADKDSAVVSELTLAAYVLRAPPLTSADLTNAVEFVPTDYAGPMFDDDYFTRIDQDGWLTPKLVLQAEASVVSRRSGRAKGDIGSGLSAASPALYVVGTDDFDAAKGRPSSTNTKLGLAEGDVLYLVDGEPFFNLEELNKKLKDAEYARDTVQSAKGRRVQLGVFRPGIEFPKQVDRSCWELEMETRIARAVAVEQLESVWARSSARGLAVTEAVLSMWLLQRKKAELQQNIESTKTEGATAVDDEALAIVAAGFDASSMNEYFETVGVIESAKSRAVEVILQRRYEGEPLGLDIETPEVFSIASVGWRAKGYIRVTGIKSREIVRAQAEAQAKQQGKEVSAFQSLPTVAEASGLGVGDIIFVVNGSREDVVNRFLAWAVAGTCEPCSVSVICASRSAVDRQIVADLAAASREVMELEIKEKMVSSFASFLMPAAQRAIVRVQAVTRAHLARRRIASQHLGLEQNPLLQKLLRTRSATRQTLWQYPAAVALHAHCAYESAFDDAIAAHAGERDAAEQGDAGSPLSGADIDSFSVVLPGEDFLVKMEDLEDFQLRSTFRLDIYNPAEFLVVHNSKTHQRAAQAIEAAMVELDNRNTLRVGDIVLALNGHRVQQLDEFDAILARTYTTQGKTLTGDVCLRVIRPKMDTVRWANSLFCLKERLRAMEAMVRQEAAVWCREHGHEFPPFVIKYMEDDALQDIQARADAELQNMAAVLAQRHARGWLERTLATRPVPLPTDVSSSILQTYKNFCQSLRQPEVTRTLLLEAEIREAEEVGAVLSVIVRRSSPDVRLGAKLDVSSSVLFSNSSRQVITIAALGAMNPLSTAGLIPGDVLLRCDGLPLQGINDLLTAVQGKATFVFEYVRPRMQRDRVPPQRLRELYLEAERRLQVRIVHRLKAGTHGATAVQLKRQVAQVVEEHRQTLVGSLAVLPGDSIEEKPATEGAAFDNALEMKYARVCAEREQIDTAYSNAVQRQRELKAKIKAVLEARSRSSIGAQSGVNTHSERGSDAISQSSKLE